MSDQKPFLNVPEPAHRPDTAPDFADFDVPRPGAVGRPPLDIAAEAARGLAYEIIRITHDDGAAIGEWANSLTVEEKLAGLRDMMRLRVFDARMLMAQRQGKTSFYMQALGEEAIACAFAKALQPGDMNFPTYRQQGLLIASGYPLINMMNQIYSNAQDPLAGRQLPVMYSSKEFGFFTISGNLATQTIQAVGWAMAAAIRGERKVAAGWIGEGSTAEADFHAALVFASTYKPPVVLNIVNNQWVSLRVDGNDYLAVNAVAKWAAERARKGFGPTVIEHITYRRGAHSTSDDPTIYRPKDEGIIWPLGDPIERLKTHLIHEGAWSDERHTQAEAEITAEVIAIQKEAEAIGTLHTGRHPAPAEMFDDVYSELPPHLIRQRAESERDQ